MSKERPWPTALSSLVVTLSDEPETAASTISTIAAHESVSVAPPEGRYLPLTIESADARVIHHWLESLPGVRFVDVVFCSTEMDSAAETQPHHV